MLIELAAKLSPRRMFVEAATQTVEVVFTNSERRQQRFAGRLDRQLVATVLWADNSGAGIEMALKAVRAVQAGPDGKDSYNSETDNPRANSLAQTLSPFLNAALRIQLNPEGKIESVEGLDAVWAAHPGLREKCTFRSVYGDAQVKNAYNSLLALLPGKPVDNGDRWSAEFAGTVLDHDVATRADCKLARVKEHKGSKLARIEFATSARAAGSSAAPTSATSNVNAEILEMSGSAEFDLVERWFSSLESLMQVAVTREVPRLDGGVTQHNGIATVSTTGSFRWLT